MIGLSLILGLALASQTTTEEVGPSLRFLRAADAGDQATMSALLTTNGGGISAGALTKKLEGCYLRRVYGNASTGSLIAAWMCAEGANKSRVVLGEIRADATRVSVSIVREDRNNVPAPARAGSALAEE